VAPLTGKLAAELAHEVFCRAIDVGQIVCREACVEMLEKAAHGGSRVDGTVRAGDLPHTHWQPADGHVRSQGKPTGNHRGRVHSGPFVSFHLIRLSPAIILYASVLLHCWTDQSKPRIYLETPMWRPVLIFVGLILTGSWLSHVIQSASMAADDKDQVLFSFADEATAKDWTPVKLPEVEKEQPVQGRNCAVASAEE
jgi:hypothetical protein